LSDFVAYPSRLRIILLTLGSIAFVGIGCWIAGAFGPPPASHRYPAIVLTIVAWTCIVFFGICAVAWIAKLFDAREQLRIGSAGIRYAAWSDRTVPWSEIIDVTTWTFKRQKMIILHLRDAARFPGRGLAARMARANRMLTGGDIAISLTGLDRDCDDALLAIANFRNAAASNAPAITTPATNFGRRSEH
jgi:hypothetical protein